MGMGQRQRLRVLIGFLACYIVLILIRKQSASRQEGLEEPQFDLLDTGKSEVGGGPPSEKGISAFKN